MANYANIIAAINAAIRSNSNQEITGPVLNTVLNGLVSSLGTGYQYKGVAIPSTNPGTPDQRVFYIAGKPGVYSNFSNLTVGSKMSVLYYDTQWRSAETELLFADALLRYRLLTGNLEWTKGKYINGADGNTGTYAADEATLDYIPVFAGDMIKTHLYASGSQESVCLYDTGRNFLSKVTGTDPDVVVSQDGYVRFSNESYATRIPKPYAYLQGVDNLNKLADDVTTLSSTIGSLSADLVLLTAAVTLLQDKFVTVENYLQPYKEYSKLFDYPIALSWTIGKCLATSTGLPTINGTNFAYTEDYFVCYPGQVFKLNGYASGTACLIAFYDKDKNFISSLTDSASGYKQKTVPNNSQIVFCRFSTENKNANAISNMATADYSLVTSDELSDALSLIQYLYGYITVNEQSPYVEQGLLVATTGEPRLTTGDYPAYRYTPQYYMVQPGQIIHTTAVAAGYDAGICYYDEFKNFVSSEDGGYNIETDHTVPAGVMFVRFSTSYYTQHGLKIIIERKSSFLEFDALQDDFDKAVDPNIEKLVFLQDRFLSIAGETPKTFDPKQKMIDIKYDGELNTEKRFLAIGFDDFRTSDFSVIAPLFEKYGYRATFNKIARARELDADAKQQVNNILMFGHEMGDHTFRHYSFPFDEPMFNGQDPSSPEGSQVPFPSNAQMRNDRGDGKNVFGIDLTTPASTTMSYNGPGIDTAWGSLSDAECQTIRNWYSVMKDTDSELILLLDTLSNRYLGTTGASRGSWNNNTQQYTGGIFTGCKTSANHEIWERYMQIMTMYYREEMGLNYNIKTWSLPGSKSSGCYFENNGKKYYDQAFTKPANDLAQMTSSLYKNQDGTSKVRSWTDVLREFGYNTTHDATFPSRIDGQTTPAMRLQNIFNAWQSRPDNLIFPTNRAISYNDIAEDYPETFFDMSAPMADQMYDVANGSFKTAIETWRFWMCAGVIWGEVIDSFDSFSERVVLENLLRYCRIAGVEVITKQEAFDICFRRRLACGNLLFNPRLRNTAKEFMPNNANVPTNPDGYRGACSASVDADGKPVLEITGNTEYFQFGVPYGNIKFSCKAKGTGKIQFAKILNKTAWGYGTFPSGAVGISEINVSSSGEFSDYDASFYIADAARTQRDGLCEYYGDKVIGLRITYTAPLQVKDMKLISLDNQ